DVAVEVTCGDQPSSNTSCSHQRTQRDQVARMSFSCPNVSVTPALGSSSSSCSQRRTSRAVSTNGRGENPAAYAFVASKSLNPCEPVHGGNQNGSPAHGSTP